MFFLIILKYFFSRIPPPVVSRCPHVVYEMKDQFIPGRQENISVSCYGSSCCADDDIPVWYKMGLILGSFCHRNI